MKNVNEMSEQECRDEIARAKGWHFAMNREIGPIGWEDPGGKLTSVTHPIADSLDAAHDSLPDNTNWDDIKRRRHRETDTKWRACVHMKLGRMQSFVVGYGSTMPLAMLRASTAAHRAGKETR